MDMPAPIISHAIQSQARPGAQAISARAEANTRFDATSIPRPPDLSIQRPTKGPPTAESSSATENIANTALAETPNSAAIGRARIAGR